MLGLIYLSKEMKPYAYVDDKWQKWQLNDLKKGKSCTWDNTPMNNKLTMPTGSSYWSVLKLNLDASYDTKLLVDFFV